MIQLSSTKATTDTGTNRWIPIFTRSIKHYISRDCFSSMPDGTSTQTRRKTRVAGILLIVLGIISGILFLIDSVQEDPAAPAYLQTLGAVTLVYGGLMAYRGRKFYHSVVAVVFYIGTIFIGLVVDAIVKGYFVESSAVAIIVTILVVIPLIALGLVLTGSDEFKISAEAD